MRHLSRAWMLACVLAACSWAASWESLNSFTGHTVRVMEQDGKEHSGELKSASASSLVVITRHGDVSLDRAQVRRMQIRSNGRRIRNAAIGAGIGVAVGITIDQTLGTRLRNESSGNGGRALSIGLPIALFGGAGALTGGWQTVYKSK